MYGNLKSQNFWVNYKSFVDHIYIWNLRYGIWNLTFGIFCWCLASETTDWNQGECLKVQFCKENLLKTLKKLLIATKKNIQLFHPLPSIQYQMQEFHSVHLLLKIPNLEFEFWNFAFFVYFVKIEGLWLVNAEFKSQNVKKKRQISYSNS